MPAGEHTWLHAGVLVVPAAVPTLLAAAVAPAAGHLLPLRLIALVSAADCKKKAASLRTQITVSQTGQLNGSQTRTQVLWRNVLNNFPNLFSKSFSNAVTSTPWVSEAKRKL